MALPEWLHVYAYCACGVRSEKPMHPDLAEHWKCASCLNQPDLFKGKDDARD